MTHISHKEFETLNWLPVTERANQCIRGSGSEKVISNGYRKQMNHSKAFVKT